MMHVGPSPPSCYPACLGFTPFNPFAHPMIVPYPLGPGYLPPAGQPPPARPQKKYTNIAPRERELGGAIDFLAPPVEGSDRAVGVAAETSSVAVSADRPGERAILPCPAPPEGLGMVLGEESSETKIAPRGGDDYAPGAPELPPLPASSVDDKLSGELASAGSSPEAAAADSSVESAPVLTPEAPAKLNHVRTQAQE